MLEKMVKGTLNKAAIITYECRGEIKKVVLGYVSGHYKFPEGTPIRTSNVTDVGADHVQTLNSVYRLGSLANEEEYKELLNTFCLFFRNKSIIAVVEGLVT